MDRRQLAVTLKNLVIFKNLSSHPLVCALSELLSSKGSDPASVHGHMCDVARELYPYGDCITDVIVDLVVCDDNFYIRARAQGTIMPSDIRAWIYAELDALSEAAAYSSGRIREVFSVYDETPKWTAKALDFRELYKLVVKNAPKNGYGVFVRNSVFTLSEAGELVPVRNPDPQMLSELYGYENERQRVIENTQALLKGLAASNVLLYGDAGTGKSSTIKAIANEYCNLGLRLIQVEKSLLRFIPALLDSLAENPLKFIIFIDDLSFNADDRDFMALKTVLEGSVAARAQNTVVYATSNRRHLIRESFAARQGDEVHLSDTLEESASLSARFGIVVTFSRPEKELYLDLVRNMAVHYGLAGDEEELFRGAEAFAIRCGGRTPRAAKQYIEYKISSAKN